MEHPTKKIAAAVNRATAQLRNRRAELLEQESVLHEIDATELVRRLVPTAPQADAKCVLILTCRNAEDSIGALLATLPRQLRCTPSIEWIVVDDGSADATTTLARRHGADHVIQFPQPRGSRAALAAGVDKALALGADYVVHVDSPIADAAEFATMIDLLFSGEADCVIAEEPPRPALPNSLRNGLLSLSGFTSRLANRPSAAAQHTPFRGLTRATALHLQPGDGALDPIDELLDREGEGVVVRSLPVASRGNGEAEPSSSTATQTTWIERLGRASVRRTTRLFWAGGMIAGLVGATLGVTWLAADGSAPRTGAAALIASLSALQLLGFAVLGENLKQQRRLLDDLRYRFRRSE